MRVVWNDLDPRTYETMVAILLNRAEPLSLRIDGKGGDGGRDVQFRLAAGLHVYELKSFVGRMDRSRRAQVQRSLRRGAALEPVRWTLVVPIDPNPHELRWFDTLRETVAFPLEWRGRTWLDGELAKYPDVQRYYVEGASEEVVRLLAELRAEEARPSTVGDVVERARTLHRRLNELDPHYQYELSIGEEASRVRPTNVMLSVLFDAARVDVYPRYAGADRDRPITIALELAFGPDDVQHREAFLRHLEYGTAVELAGAVIHRVAIDAPSGLGATFHGGVVEIGARQPSAPPVHTVAQILDGERVIAALPLEMRVTAAGIRGGLLDGCDASGWLHLAATIDMEARRFTARFRVEPTAILPATVLPLISWLGKLGAPHAMALQGGLWSSPTPTVLTNEPLVGPEYIALIDAFATVQRVSGTYFDMPVDLTSAEASAILVARDLLRGEPVESRWRTPVVMTLNPGEDARKAVRQAIADGGGRLLIERDEHVVIRGNRIPLGRVRTIFHAARILNPHVLEDPVPSEAPTVQFVPGDDDRVTRQCLPAH